MDNTSIISEVPITLIKLTDPIQTTQCNLENCEFDLAIPKSVLLSNTQDDVFTCIRCNFKQDEISMLTNTTQTLVPI